MDRLADGADPSDAFEDDGNGHPTDRLDLLDVGQQFGRSGIQAAGVDAGVGPGIGARQHWRIAIWPMSMHALIRSQSRTMSNNSTNPGTSSPQAYTMKTSGPVLLPPDDRPGYGPAAHDPRNAPPNRAGRGRSCPCRRVRNGVRMRRSHPAIVGRKDRDGEADGPCCSPTIAPDGRTSCAPTPSVNRGRTPAPGRKHGIVPEPAGAIFRLRQPGDGTSHGVEVLVSCLGPSPNGSSIDTVEFLSLRVDQLLQRSLPTPIRSTARGAGTDDPSEESPVVVVAAQVALGPGRRAMPRPSASDIVSTIQTDLRRFSPAQTWICMKSWTRTPSQPPTIEK